MTTHTRRSASLASLFTALIGASLALGSVACGAAPYGTDGTETASGSATAKEETPAAGGQDDAGPGAKPGPVGDTAGEGTAQPTAGSEGTGGGSAYVTPPANNAHPMHSAE